MDKAQRAVLIVVLASYTMILLDTSIVITGLPEIRAELGFSPVMLSWVQTSYMLAFGGFLMLGARAGDLFGRRRVFLAGLSLFTLSSLVIGAAPNAAVLLAARAVQGLGAAVLAPSTLALLQVHFAEGEERTRALSLYAATAGIGSSLGLVLGGVFAGWLSWRVGFFINVPVGIAVYLAARHLLTETPASGGSLDIASALTSTFGMAALVFGILRIAEVGPDSLTLAALALGAVVLMAFFLRQAWSTAPLLPLRLFHSPVRSGAYAARMMFIGAMMGFFFLTTQLMQNDLGFTPVQAGLGFLPMTGVTFLASLALPRLTRVLGNGGVLVLAFGCGALGLFWLSFAGQDYLTSVALPMLLLGFGNGSALGPLTVAGVQGVQPADAGAASGLVNVAHQLGGSLGVAGLAAVAASFGGLHIGLIVAAALLAIGMVTSIAFIARPFASKEFHHENA
ncbi:MFS transporter [Cypionkella sinensis]|uniref:MFS transporter n=2 Tax=Cypionkella sinensis TaxID=1756043 RepID=A0ABV7J0K4_9RHOB